MEQFFLNENITDILKDPERIFNCDVNFFLSPKETAAVLVKKGCKDRVIAIVR